MSSLSIVIPTYNRADKLLRLLGNIETELANCRMADQVQILVSDNASTDDTQTKVASFRSQQFGLNYFRQERNIGFDGNVRFLYEVAKTDYVWFFSDDDILLPGAISTVLKGLTTIKPDVLLFSFIQPMGSKIRTFDFPDQFAYITDAKEIIRTFARCSKVSQYVCRKIELNELQRKELEPFYENGFFWLDLCFSILSTRDIPSLCIISEPLASCDQEFHNIRFGPSVFLRSYTVYKHPYVCVHLPKMAAEYQISAYYDAIQLMFAVKLGSLISDEPSLFEKEIKSFRFMPSALTKNPRALMQLLLLKLRLVYLYRAYKKILNFFTQSAQEQLLHYPKDEHF